MAENFAKKFIDKLEAQAKVDLAKVRDQLGDFIDKEIIDRKFHEGFPGHELQYSTRARKGNARVGIDSGRLRKAATAFTNYSLYSPDFGRRYRLMQKKKAGLTPYSHLVKTRVGGELDIIGIDAQDIIQIERKTSELLKKYNIGGNGLLKIVRKNM